MADLRKPIEAHPEGAPASSLSPSDHGSFAWVYEAVEDNEVRLVYLKGRSAPGQQNSQTLNIPLRAIVFVTEETALGDISILYVKPSGSEEDAVPEVFRAHVSGLPTKLGVGDVSFGKRLFRATTEDPRPSKPLLEVVISVGSGLHLAKKFWQSALQPILATLKETTDFDLVTHETTSAETITQLAQTQWRVNAAERQDYYIVLLSGDGGAVDAVNGLELWHDRAPATPRPTIVTLPLGSGNALFNSYSYHLQDDTWGLSTLVRGTARPLTSFCVHFSPGAKLVIDEGRGEQALALEGGHPTLHGVVVCSWGLHATLVADSDTAEYRKFGPKRFGMVAAKLLNPEDGSLPHQYTGTVSYLNEDSVWVRLEGKARSYVLATLVSNLEKTFMISPESVSQDGKLRLVELPPLAGDRIMQIMGAAYDSGKHIAFEEVGYHRINGLRIELDEEEDGWRRVCIDGKIVRLEHGGWLEVQLDKDSGVDYIGGPNR